MLSVKRTVEGMITGSMRHTKELSNRVFLPQKAMYLGDCSLFNSLVIRQGDSMGNVLRLHRPPQNRLKLPGFVEQRRLIIFVPDRLLPACSPGSA